VAAHPAQEGLGRTGVDYACAFAMHPFAEVVGLVEPRGDLRRFVRGAGFGAPSESSFGCRCGRRMAVGRSMMGAKGDGRCGSRHTRCMAS